MTELLVFVSAMVWLGSGGWAFQVLMRRADDVTQEQLGALLAFCLVLAPFAAGMALCKVPDGDAS